MYYYIKGKLTYLTPTFAVVEAGGVGYKLTISQTTHSALPSRQGGNDPEVKLFTHLAVREDDIELLGFYTETELATFKLLITVSGVGPKAAISILSQLTPEKFALAVCTDDKKAISKANGIGPKTAARVILELKDKLQKEMSESDGDMLETVIPETVISGKGNLAEAQDALMVLGFTRAEAANTLKAMDPALSVEELIKEALKKLM